VYHYPGFQKGQVEEESAGKTKKKARHIVVWYIGTTMYHW
jgi:hypothetical protein